MKFSTENPKKEVRKKILETGEKMATTIINVHGLLCGLKNYVKPVDEVTRLPALDCTKKDAVLAAEIELKTEVEGIMKCGTGAMIAAITINNKASLCTFDQKHFQPIKALNLLNLQL